MDYSCRRKTEVTTFTYFSLNFQTSIDLSLNSVSIKDLERKYDVEILEVETPFCLGPTLRSKR